MSHRLQVLIPKELDAQLNKTAQRKGVSKGEWVRRVLRTSLELESKGSRLDPVSRLASLGAPTGDIGQLLTEIDSGRQ